MQEGYRIKMFESTVTIQTKTNMNEKQYPKMRTSHCDVKKKMEISD